MTEQPLYRLQLTYSREDYRKYLAFYKVHIKKTSFKLVFYFIISLIIGVVVSHLAGNWIYLGLFLVMGIALEAYLLWSQRKIDERMVNRELKLMPVVYRFMQDRLVASNAGGNEVSVKYHDLYTMYEVDWAYYIMLDKDTAAIIPKDKCSEDLQEFIRNLGKVKADWYAQQGKVAS